MKRTLPFATTQGKLCCSKQCSFHIYGVVEKGLGEARKTGFPTLNISYKPDSAPRAQGIRAGFLEVESAPPTDTLKSPLTPRQERGVLRATNKVTEGAILPIGVYAAEVRLDGQVYLAAACVGADWGIGQVPKLEVYLFDAEERGLWHSKAVEVILLKKIRDLVRFKDIGHARTNIARDVKKIKTFFQNR